MSEKEKKSESFIQLSKLIIDNISKIEQLRDNGKFTLPTNETELKSKVKSFVSLFFKSMELTICCCEIMDI